MSKRAPKTKQKTLNVATATDEQKEAVVSYAAETVERITPMINSGQEEILLRGEDAASLVITIQLLYYELDKAVLAHNAILETLNSVAANITTGLAENTEQDHRIRAAIENVLASGTLADLHKGWALDQVLRILTGCQGAKDSEGYQQALARYYSATDEQWDKGMEP